MYIDDLLHTTPFSHRIGLKVTPLAYNILNPNPESTDSYTREGGRRSER